MANVSNGLELLLDLLQASQVGHGLDDRGVATRGETRFDGHFLRVLLRLPHLTLASNLTIEQQLQLGSLDAAEQHHVLMTVDERTRPQLGFI